MSRSQNPPVSVSKQRFTIIGAGLAGSLMATLLAKRNLQVEVYEKRPDPRIAGYVGGRSINLALSTRGLWGLEQAGLHEEIMQFAVPMRGRMIHGRDSSLVFSPYGVEANQAINSVPRGDLNIMLLNAAEQAGAKLHFDHRLESLDVENSKATFVQDDAGGEPKTVETGAIIGADGAFSAVRSHLQLRDRFDYSQTYLEHGYKELHIPPDENGKHRMEPNALHIWPRGDFMMIALPNQDGSFTVTLFWPFEGNPSFAALRTEEDVRDFFQETFPDAVPLLPTLLTDYFNNPTASLVTVRCKPWYLDDRCVLIGDAAHAVVPFFGQGINCGFEDCGLLLEAFDKHPDDLARAFKEYGDARKPDADALADLCIYNFIEMRAKTASPMFRLQQRVDKLMAKVMPQRWQPMYSMVTFSRIPYAEVVRRWTSRREKLRAFLTIAFVLGVALIATVLFMLAITSGAFGNGMQTSSTPEPATEAIANVGTEIDDSWLLAATQSGARNHRPHAVNDSHY